MIYLSFIFFNNIFLFQRKMTDTDHFKISALDWITYYEEQKAEAVVQVNALIFSFLIQNKIDAAQLAINKVPSDTVSKIISTGKYDLLIFMSDF